MIINNNIMSLPLLQVKSNQAGSNQNWKMTKLVLCTLLALTTTAVGIAAFVGRKYLIGVSAAALSIYLGSKSVKDYLSRFSKKASQAPQQGPLPKNVSSQAAAISIGTYNILFPQPQIDPRNPPPQLKGAKFENVGYSFTDGQVQDNFKYRAGVIADNIHKANLDIVCMQEMTDESLSILKQKLSDYDFVWDRHKASTFKTCRNKNLFGQTVNHGVAIFYKKNACTLLDKKIERCAVKLANGKTKDRVHVGADLQIKGKTIRVVAGHFTDPREFAAGHKGEQVNEALKLASEKSQHVFDATIIAGDMNQDEWGDIENQKSTPDVHHAEAFQQLFQNNFEVDGDYSPSEFDKEFTNQEAQQKPEVYNTIPKIKSGLNGQSRHIDWIFAKGKGFNRAHMDLSACSLTGSDHRLVGTNLVWP